MSHLKLIVILSVTLSCAITAVNCFGQDGKDAAAAASKGDFATAISIYESLLKRNPADLANREQLGIAYLQAEKYPEAVQTLKRAIDDGFKAPSGAYNLACAYARVGDKRRALDLLEDAIHRGLAVPFTTDPDLASLREEPRFKQLAVFGAAMVSSSPCKDSQAHPQFRQLDFWVGEWDVYNGSQKVGESSVKLILNDCVVFENWRSGRGGEGKSLNKYDPVNAQWQQFWVSDDGGTIFFTGNLVEGEMRYESTPPLSSAAPKRKLTFSRMADGRIRQLGELSADQGKNWSTEYDFTYVRRAGPTD